MTSGEAEQTETGGGQTETGGGQTETGGGQTETGGGQTETEDLMKPRLSFTTLSTVAVQAGRSQLVLSVLQSGSVVHLQLVQVHPGLCEIGANQEENQNLIQEQQQLMEKLKKHEREVLAVVQRKRRDEGRMEQRRRRKKEEEEELHKAMEASLSEGWSLLLRLLHRRQEVLTLASDFYCRALEFAVGMDGVEDLQTRATGDRLTDAYDTMRRDLLGKSMQVLTSSSVLLQKLRQLQRTEALQRRGGVLQDEEEEEEDESSQCSGGAASRLEELVEVLQDRRRRADQAVRLRLQQAENNIMVPEEGPESREAGSEDWSLQILEETLEPESTSDVQPGSRSHGSDDPRNLESGSTSPESTDLESDLTKETKDLQPGPRLEHTAGPGSDPPGLRLKPGSIVEELQNLQSGFKLTWKGGSRSDLKSKSEKTGDHQPESRLDQTLASRSDVPGSRLDLEYGSDPTREKDSGFRSEGNRNFETEFSSDVQRGSRLDPKSPSKSNETRNLESGSTSVLSTDLKLDSPTAETTDLQTESSSDVKSVSRAEEFRNLQTGSRSDLKSDTTKHHQPGSRLDPFPVSGSDTPGSGQSKDQGFRSKGTRNFESVSSSGGEQGSRIHESGSRSEKNIDLKSDSTISETRDLQHGLQFKPGYGAKAFRNLKTESGLDPPHGSKSNVQPGSRLGVNPESKLDQTRDVDPGPGLRSEETRELRSDIQPGATLDLKSSFKTRETRTMQSGSTSVKSQDLNSDSTAAENGSRSRLELKSGSGVDGFQKLKSNLKGESSSDLKSGVTRDPRSRSDVKPESASEQTRLDQTPGAKSDLQPKSNEPRIQESASTSERSTDLKSTTKDIVDLQPGSRSVDSPDLQPGSRSVDSPDLQPGTRSDVKPRPELKPGSSLKQTRDLCPESRTQETTNLLPEKKLQSGSKPVLKPESRRVLLPGSGFDLKLGSRSEEVTKQEVTKQEVTTQARAAASSGQVAGLQSMLGNQTQSVEDHAHNALLTNKKRELLSSCELLLDKIWSWVQHGGRMLSSVSEAGGQLVEAEHTLNKHLQLRTQAESAGRDAENMKRLLDQIRALHTGSTDRTRSRGQPLPLQTLTDQLKRGRTSPPARDPSLSPQLAGQVDLVLKELQTLNKKIDSNLQLLQHYVAFLRRARQVEEEVEELREIYTRRPEGEEEEAAPCWQETLQRVLAAQELGENFVHTVPMGSGAGLNLQSVVSVVTRTLERLSRTKQEVDELRGQQQIQIQQQEEYCRKYRERLVKTLQDLNGVSELLDSCTLMDLGSDLQTSRLQKHFSQARPHFTQLDAEVEHMERNWETLRAVQDRLELNEFKEGAVKEEDLSGVLKLHKTVKNKIHQSESILDLTSRFHLTSRRLEELLQADPESPGSSAAEDQQRVRSLFQTVSTLKMDICNAIDHSGWSCFRAEQLETRLLSLDSFCVSWLNEAARREEKLALTSKLNDDIIQLRDSFKELKKRFSNLKFNYLKRNDRTRNVKAVRNQLQQVEMYEEKLQALSRRLQAVAARLGSEVRDGGVAREAEDAINELQRQMGDLERSISDHQKTLEMTRKLQQAMEEYQFWCEEASATIDRVGRFSSECRSTEAVSVLYRQFEKFVWPTVPEQEERISRIAELAVRLHGAEEGQRFIEKTVSKHSEMVESIRELSDGLMELEAKLKMESLRKQQNDGEKKVKEEGESERRREDGSDQKEQKENCQVKKTEQKDNRSAQDAADMYELKETGHTPELTPECDGKEVPVKRKTAANRKPPLQKSRSQEAESSHRQTFTSSYSSTHTFSLSCSPVEANRRIHAIPAAAGPQATPLPPGTGPLFSDIQREFQRKEGSASCGSNMTQLQDASAEAELQHEEVMTDDSLSSDEYDCASPDDISLPPLAETPDSHMVQSDVEEGFCFSSHSGHRNQSSHQGHAQAERSGTGSGAVRQAESCPTPPPGLHSSTRSESVSFAQSPLTVPAPNLITSSLCSTQKTYESRTDKIPPGSPKQDLPSGPNPVPQKDTSESYSNEDKYVPQMRSPSPTQNLFKEDCSQCDHPQRRICTQNVASKGETLSQTDLKLQAPTRLQSNYYLLPCDGRGPDLKKGTTPSLKSSAFPQTTTTICSEGGRNQDRDSFQMTEETASKPQRNGPTHSNTRTMTQQTLYVHSARSDSPFSGIIDPVPHSPNIPESVPNKNTTISSNPLRDSWSGLDQDVPSPQTQTSGVSMPRDTTDTPKHRYSQSSPGSTRWSFSQRNEGLPEVHAQVLPEPNCFNVSISSSGQQGHQTVYALQESLTFTRTQQCVHDPGMTSSSPTKPTAPPQTDSQTQASAQQANLHVAPLPSSPHPLTPDQDPNLCQPMAIREEIRLTPQIRGPSIPAPPTPPPARAESLPQGKASRPGPPCFTRPLSRATVMEGSPVTLEVEVTGHPEPTLTWFQDGEVSAAGPGQTPACEDRNHFLFVPETSDSDEGSRGDAQRADVSRKWLLAEVFDIITVDWHTWFGTLCVLLWLLYLILL